jgi:ATP-binding cassette subfamily C (CFTR/MRP) protein 1
MTTGYKRPLEKEDLYTLPDWRHSKNLTQKFQGHWKRQLKRKNPNLFFALNQTFGAKFWFGGVCRLLADTLSITSPCKNLLTFVCTVCNHLIKRLQK